MARFILDADVGRYGNACVPAGDMMGHHIIYKDGKVHFQSDLHPELPLDHIILDFDDPAARQALWGFADFTKDRELSKDIREVLMAKTSGKGLQL